MRDYVKTFINADADKKKDMIRCPVPKSQFGSPAYAV